MTMIQIPIHIHHPLITFVATRGPKSFSLCALHTVELSTDFNGSFSNSHQIFIRPWSRLQYIVSTHQLHFLPLGGKFCLYLCALCRAEFSMDFLQIHQIFIGPRSRLLSFFVTHLGAKFVFLVCTDTPHFQLSLELQLS